MSVLWEQRINDFTPVNIISKSDVTVIPYDYRKDPVEPKTHLTFPDSTEFTHDDNIDIVNKDTKEGVYAQLSIKSPLNIRCEEGAGANVTGHEADVKITTITGDCDLSKVKTGSVEINSDFGNVNVNSLVSNAVIFSKGNITGKKVQGEKFTICNSQGNINIESLYAPEAAIYGKHGNVTLGDVHGFCKIVTTGGNVRINSSQDDLDIKCSGGHVNVTLQDIRKSVLIQSYGGNVTLMVSPEVCSKAMLSVRGSGHPNISDEVKHKLNENMEATALVQLITYDAGIFVGMAKSWGEDLWGKIQQKQDEDKMKKIDE